MLEDKQAILRLVTDRFIAEGRDSTVAEIAARLCWGESRVRKLLARPLEGLRVGQESRPSHSRDYPGMEAGTHRVWVYGPTREHLSSLLLAAARRG